MRSDRQNFGEGEMTNPISGRLDRPESEIESPGYPPVFRLIDDPRDPENAQRLEEAERFRRDNPSGLIIHRLIVYPRRLLH